MSTSFNSQLLNNEKMFKIQFETDNYDYFKFVEKACQKAIDDNDKALRIVKKWSEEND